MQIASLLRPRKLDVWSLHVAPDVSPHGGTKHLARPSVAVLFTLEARTRAVKRRARPATALAVSSCSTWVTTAAAAASKAMVGWTRSHASLPRGRQRASRRRPLRHAYCLVSGLTARPDRLRPTLGDEAVHLPGRAGVSALPDLTPQCHGILTALADPPHEVAHVHIEQARADTMGQSGWEDVGRSVFAYSGASQPHRVGDPEQGLAARTPSTHLVVDGSPSRPALRLCVKLRGAAWEGVIAPGRKICRAGGVRPRS
jgi:hypothetical protein